VSKVLDVDPVLGEFQRFDDRYGEIQVRSSADALAGHSGGGGRPKITLEDAVILRPISGNEHGRMTLCPDRDMPDIAHVQPDSGADDHRWMSGFGMIWCRTFQSGLTL